jgi:hypothetical protein
MVLMTVPGAVMTEPYGRPAAGLDRPAVSGARNPTPPTNGATPRRRRRRLHFCRSRSYRDSTTSPKASQSGFSHTKRESRTVAISAASAVTPHCGQMGARSTSAPPESVTIRCTTSATNQSQPH